MQNDVTVIIQSKVNIIKKNFVHVNEASFLIRSVRNAIRQEIICILLSGGKHGVNELCEEMQVRQAIMSQHLAVLRKAQLVKTQRTGKYIFYSIDEDHLNKVVEFIQQITPAKG